MAKKSQPARATRLEDGVPLKATPLTVGEQESKPKPMKTPDPHQRKLEEFRQQLKTESSGKGEAARAKKGRVTATLEKIRTQFGEEEFRRAVKDFQQSFHNFDKINLLRNKGPGVEPSKNLQPPPS